MARVLVVDDNAINRQLCHDVLRHRGHAVAEAIDGRDALEQISTAHPDVVVLDIQMPGMSGLEVLRQVRASADHRIAHTPVIAATALAMAGDRERCLSAGASEYLPRPFTLKQLVALVESLALPQVRHE
jgi:CheY-like chemotaxis protein